MRKEKLELQKQVKEERGGMSTVLPVQQVLFQKALFGSLWKCKIANGEQTACGE